MNNLHGDEDQVLELRVPASGGTAEGTFLVVVESDETDVESTWPWPETWPVQADS